MPIQTTRSTDQRTRRRRREPQPALGIGRFFTVRRASRSQSRGPRPAGAKRWL